MNPLIIKILPIAIMLIAVACGKAQTSSSESSPSVIEERGEFSADSAYSFVASQVGFGPRVPGTAAHNLCREWLVAKLYEFGADTVMVVGTETTAWDGTKLPVRNILAKFKGISQSRPLLLAAHYDTRPWADEDSDADARTKPFDGANDGASGVGVLLEIARNLGKEPAHVPVDILLTDVEDYGSTHADGSWCLGSQQFADNLPYSPSAMPRWGVLLDMVGGRDAKFSREVFSLQVAPAQVQKIWDMAGRLGLRNRFPTSIGGAINDDHLPLSRAGIPTADIIESSNPQTGSFPPSWHTRADNLSNIDPSTLKDVGRVVLNVIYNEK